MPSFRTCVTSQSFLAGAPFRAVSRIRDTGRFGRLPARRCCWRPITALVLWRARAQPYLAVGWFWFLGMLAPAIGLVQVGIQSMADRYSYLPTVGISIMVVWAACECLAQRPGGDGFLERPAAIAIAACMVLTPRQALYWRDSDTLFEHASR